MKIPRSLGIWSLLLLSALSLPSCLSVMVVSGTFDGPPRTSNIDEVKNAYITEDQHLVLNCKGNLHNSEKAKDFYIDLPLDQKEFNQKWDSTSASYSNPDGSKGLEAPYKSYYVYRESDYDLYTLTTSKKVIKKGEKKADGKSKEVKVDLIQPYAAFDVRSPYMQNGTENVKIAVTRGESFEKNAYMTPEVSISMKDKGKSLSIYLEPKRKFPRLYLLPLLPVTFVIDLVTLPIQLYVLSRIRIC